MNRNLYPLRVPTGWAVTYNAYFAAVDMDVVNGRIVNFEYFKEDLLMIQQLALDGERWAVQQDGWLLDVGWYPESDPNGAYRLSLVRGQWDEVAFSVTSKSGDVIQRAIDEFLGGLSRNESVADLAQRVGSTV